MKPTAKIIVISAFLAFCSTSLADELLVPAQYLTVQSAIDAAIDGDTVIVAPGTYTGPGNRDIDFKGRTITVRSTDPNDPNIVAATIIDCNSDEPYCWGMDAIIDYGTETGLHQGFYFHSGEDANSTVEGFTIIRGYIIRGHTNYYGGGGICCYKSSPKIANCTISGNPIGIYCNESNSIIAGCTISDNLVCGISCYNNSSPVITDCNITGSSGYYYYYSGGGIRCIGGSPTITNCIISDNNAGGIYCSESNSVITNCIISDNNTNGIYCIESKSVIINCIISDNSSRGIYCFQGSSTITNCTISNNKGGGIYGYYSNPTITNCNITGNSAYYYGGGIYGCDGPITNCTITGNSAKYDGGGLCECSGPIKNCIITGNSASEGGGLCFCWDSITNCIITGNSAYYEGGGLAYCFDPVTNCIISGNSAKHNGGGMAYCFGPVTNCIITGNSANKSGGGIAHAMGPFVNCTIANNSAVVSGGGLYAVAEAEATNCIIWGNWPEQLLTWPITVTYSNVQGGWVGEGNIDADPCFIEPGYWADVNDPNIITEPNDPNATWLDGDYHLKSEGWRWDSDANQWTWDEVTSRCIDAGNPGSPLGDEPLTLIVDPLNRWGENLRIDMGAYGGTAEASIPPYDWAILADLTNDGKVDLNDLAAFVNYWLDSGECIPSDLNRNQFVDLFDFALLAEDWLGQTTWH